MTWAAIVPLITQYGLPVAELIWQKVESGAQVTQADWDALKVMASATARDRVLAALQRAGIDPQSEQGKAILAAAG